MAGQGAEEGGIRMARSRCPTPSVPLPAWPADGETEEDRVLGAFPVPLSSRDPVAEGTKRISRVCLPFCPFPLFLWPSLSKWQGAVKGLRKNRIRGPTHGRVLSCQVLPLTAREAKTWYPQSREGRTWGLGTSLPAVLLSRGTSEKGLGSRDTCF